MKRPSTIIIGAPKGFAHGEGMIYSQTKYAERRGIKAINCKDCRLNRPHLQTDRHSQAYSHGASGGVSAGRFLLDHVQQGRYLLSQSGGARWNVRQGGEV